MALVLSGLGMKNNVLICVVIYGFHQVNISIIGKEYCETIETH